MIFASLSGTTVCTDEDVVSVASVQAKELPKVNEAASKATPRAQESFVFILFVLHCYASERLLSAPRRPQAESNYLSRTAQSPRAHREAGPVKELLRSEPRPTKNPTYAFACNALWNHGANVRPNWGRGGGGSRNPLPSLGGAMLGTRAGIALQNDVEIRSVVKTGESAVLGGGHVRPPFYVRPVRSRGLTQ